MTYPKGSKLLFVTLACFGLIANAYAITPGFTEGKILAVYADPSDFVVLLDTNGPCGSAFFHSQRVNTNFKEAVAIALTGFSTAKTVGFWVASCTNDRNITTQAYVRN
jgi:hypothetical protein